jgi:predicted RNA-binding protein
MPYYTALFSPETYEAFSRSDQTVSGFQSRQRNAASGVQVGDKLICYMTKLSRWVGVLEIVSESYRDDTTIFKPENDPYIIRFKVKPLAWLAKEHAIPIKDDRVWNKLSFTREHDKNTSTWTGIVRSSLRPLSSEDGRFLEQLIMSQADRKEVFEINEGEYERLITHTVRRADKVVTVSVPEEAELEAENVSPTSPDVRESIKIQALLARIGAQMGMKIWIPRNDRGGVFSEWRTDDRPILDVLPLNYDETTLKTIEQIDVLWLRGRSIVRAFEVEHTTSIYSGILRMADLLALQPNMNIKLHIVAPESRREKVFQEIRRPVFSLLENNPLSESCTYLSYESVRDLSELRHLEYLSDSVLDEYAEEAE